MRFDIAYVSPGGLANLGLGDESSSYVFRSPANSARPPGVPKNVEVDIPCHIEVTVGTKLVEVDVRNDDSCKGRLRPFPRCSMRQIWEKAKAAGADLDTVAKVAFLPDGMWWFDNENSDGEGLAESYPDACP